MALLLMADQHVPGAITRGLRVRGIDVLSAFEDHSHELPDDELLERATGCGRILVTQDHDLLVIAHEWQRSERAFAGLVYFHQLNITIGKAIADLEIIGKCCNAKEFANHVQILPFR